MDDRTGDGSRQVIAPLDERLYPDLHVLTLQTTHLSLIVVTRLQQVAEVDGDERTVIDRKVDMHLDQVIEQLQG